jgi:hypothetical protein
MRVTHTDIDWHRLADGIPMLDEADAFRNRVITAASAQTGEPLELKLDKDEAEWLAEAEARCGIERGD